ncbi:MAG: homoserine O-succinyltransferase [Pseudomonadota bacterium]
MPIKIPNNLPARDVLTRERVSIIREDRAVKQDIRPLEIAILNLMPDKIATETQLLRVLGATPLQINVTFLRTESYSSKNTAKDHLESFYTTLVKVKNRRFDALVVTGAPVEDLEYEQVDYWPELVEILEWSKQNCFARLYICWGAQAGLYHNHGIKKYTKDEKLFGVFDTKIHDFFHPLTQGFDSTFRVPISRHTSVLKSDIQAIKDLKILAESENDELCLIHNDKTFDTYMFNHLEYDSDTLKREYDRDAASRGDVPLPHNYFPNNDPSQIPEITWRSHRYILFSNWINMIYQGTPFDLSQLPLK